MYAMKLEALEKGHVYKRLKMTVLNSLVKKGLPWSWLTCVLDLPIDEWEDAVDIRVGSTHSFADSWKFEGIEISIIVVFLKLLPSGHLNDLWFYSDWMS